MVDFKYNEDIDSILTTIREEKFRKKEKEDFLDTLRSYLHHLDTKKEFTYEVIDLLRNKNKSTREIATSLLDGKREHRLFFSVSANKAHVKELDEVLLNFKNDLIDLDIKITQGGYGIRYNYDDYDFTLAISHNGVRVSIINKDADAASYKELLEKELMQTVDKAMGSALSQDEILGKIIETTSEKIYPDVIDYLNLHYIESKDKEGMKAKIISYLDSEDKNLREIAVTLILMWRLENAKDLLEPLKKDKNTRIKKMVGNYVSSLEMVFDLLSKDELETMIKSDHEHNRKYAIHIAAEKGDLVAVKFLLKNGYKLTDTGLLKRRAIHSAVASSNSDLVSFLLANKSKATQLDGSMNTPLHRISHETPLKTVTLLLENGADINVLNKHQRSVFYYTLKNAGKNLIDFFIQKGVKLSELDDHIELLRKCRIENLTLIVEYLKSENYSFDMRGLYDDIKDNDVEHVKFLYDEYDILQKGGELHILQAGDLEFIKLLAEKGFDFNGVIPEGTEDYFYNDLTPYLFIVYRNEKEGVREFILNNKNFDLSVHKGNKEEFYFEHLSDRWSLQDNYTSLLSIALYSSSLQDVKDILEKGGEKISDLIIATALDAGTTCLGYLLEHYYDDFTPFRIVTKDGKETLLSMILKEYTPSKNDIFENFLKNSHVKKYIADNNFEAKILQVSKHYLNNLHKAASSTIENTMKGVKSLGPIYEYLESEERDKREAALSALQNNEAFYECAKNRYLNLIKARLNDPTATLEDFPKEGLYTKGQLLDLNYSHWGKDHIDFSFGEPKIIVDFIGAVTSNYVDIDQFIKDTKKLSKEKRKALQMEGASALLEKMKMEAKGNPEGWYSQTLDKLIGMNGVFDKILFDQTQFISEEYLFAEAFFFFLGSLSPTVHLDIFQSIVELPDSINILLSKTMQNSY